VTVQRPSRSEFVTSIASGCARASAGLRHLSAKLPDRERSAPLALVATASTTRS
jgi:hypothetical protein